MWCEGSDCQNYDKNEAQCFECQVPVWIIKGTVSSTELAAPQNQGIRLWEDFRGLIAKQLSNVLTWLYPHGAMRAFRTQCASGGEPPAETPSDESCQAESIKSLARSTWHNGVLLAPQSARHFVITHHVLTVIQALKVSLVLFWRLLLLFLVEVKTERVWVLHGRIWTILINSRK